MHLVMYYSGKILSDHPVNFASSQEKEVVTVRDDDAGPQQTPLSAVQAAASRHRSSEDDDGDIEAVLEIYSPRRAAHAQSASPTKKRTSPRRLVKKQSTLESEFRMKEVIMSSCIFTINLAQPLASLFCGFTPWGGEIHSQKEPSSCSEERLLS